jgi:hypothetical protein
VASPIVRVRVSRADLEALDRRARADRISRSDLLRSLLRAGLQTDDAFTVEPLQPPS